MQLQENYVPPPSLPLSSINSLLQADLLPPPPLFFRSDQKNRRRRLFKGYTRVGSRRATRVRVMYI